MPNKWYPLSALTDQQGHGRQFYAEEGEVFVAGYVRAGGPDDAHMPRRILGHGASARRARASAHAIISRYDPSGTIVTTR